MTGGVAQPRSIFIGYTPRGRVTTCSAVGVFVHVWRTLRGNRGSIYYGRQMFAVHGPSEEETAAKHRPVALDMSLLQQLGARRCGVAACRFNEREKKKRITHKRKALPSLLDFTRAYSSQQSALSDDP